MDRRRFLIRGLPGLAALLAWLGIRRRSTFPMAAESSNDRVVFVCCDDHGGYGPGVYLHGPAGGGPACLQFAEEAAHCMRAGETSDSAAGLCGFLFTRLGEDAGSSGMLSLWDSPRPGPDKQVDWQAYCPWNVDLVLINVDRRTAECYVSRNDREAAKKSITGKITDLKFGG